MEKRRQLEVDCLDMQQKEKMNVWAELNVLEGTIVSNI